MSDCEIFDSDSDDGIMADSFNGSFMICGLKLNSKSVAETT